MVAGALLARAEHSSLRGHLACEGADLRGRRLARAEHSSLRGRYALWAQAGHACEGAGLEFREVREFRVCALTSLTSLISLSTVLCTLFSLNFHLFLRFSK